MPCSSTGYIVQNGTAWKGYSSAEVKAASKKAESHAECQAFQGFGNKSGPYLIVQDAFPCFDKCHQYFLAASNTYSVIIKITADNSFDGASYVEEGLIAGLSAYPYYIYYRNGVATFRTGVPNAPQGFPAHPGPQNV